MTKLAETNEKYTREYLFECGRDKIFDMIEKNDPKLDEVNIYSITSEYEPFPSQEARTTTILKRFERLAKALEANTNLKILNLVGNQISEDAAKLLSGAIIKNKGLEQLGLSDCAIGDNGIKHFSDSLEHNKTIKGIGFSGNQITAEGAKFLGKSLKENTTLNSLRLTNNKLGDEGLGYLVESGVIERLQRLDIGRNDITTIGLKQLAPELRKAKNLKIFGLNRSEFTDEELEILIPALTDSNIKELIIRSNRITLEKDGLAQALKTMLQTTPVEKLDVSYNVKMTVDGWKIIKGALNKDSREIEINYERNDKIGVYEFQLKKGLINETPPPSISTSSASAFPTNAPSETQQLKMEGEGLILTNNISPPPAENHEIPDKSWKERTEEQKKVSSNNSCCRIS